ncbi:unnamed protein product [Didymodactylos carnosus]|uniref:Ig-like domain-containing protein n=1 Tax=Didymodactylos carnosus TaxID=1234261 RepID=A0A814MSM4_9BILA|nr:unnamed protein product [Didymodactylos carnosus]CAF3848775.1 unnamed protein product [Didymodactylos carnosus]
MFRRPNLHRHYFLFSLQSKSIDSCQFITFHMKNFYLNWITYLFLLMGFAVTTASTISCSCDYSESSSSMVCKNIQSLNHLQQCINDQLALLTHTEHRRGYLMTNLTVTQHHLRVITDKWFEFTYNNNQYKLSSLRYLYVKNGQLNQIENEAFQTIGRSLDLLDLSYNDFRQIPLTNITIPTHTPLSILILSHNKIKRLDVNDLKNFLNINRLELSYNKLEYVDINIIRNLSKLKVFYINNNSLRTLSPSSNNDNNNNFTLTDNFRLKLSGNPLECDCHLRWLRTNLNRLEYPVYSDDPVCEMPKALSGKKIQSLREEQFVCGPIITKPNLTLLVASSGQKATLRCDVYSDPAPDVWWTYQNRVISKITSPDNEEHHFGPYTLKWQCIRNKLDQCLNKTSTLTITDIGIEHNGTYNCVAAIKNQERSDNDYLSYELRVHRVSIVNNTSLLLWIIVLLAFIFALIVLFICICVLVRCHRSKKQQAERNKALLFDNNSLLNGQPNGNGGISGIDGIVYKEKDDNSFITNNSYDHYDMINSHTHLGPPMYSELPIESTPLKSIGGGSISSTLPLHYHDGLRHYHHGQQQADPHDRLYDSYRSDRQLYEQISRPSPLEPIVVDEFEDEMIFPSGYEEDYEYREDICKPNQNPDPRRQKQMNNNTNNRVKSSTNQNTTINDNATPLGVVNVLSTTNNKLILSPTTTTIPSQQKSTTSTILLPHQHQNDIRPSNSFENYKFDRSESQYAGLSETQL